jgi:adenylate cyclase
VLRSSLWRQLRVALMTGLLAGGIGAALAYLRPHLTEQLEDNIYDVLVRRADPHLKAPSIEPVVLVTIDDESIDDVRQQLDTGWPWPRSLIGRGVEELKALGARVIVLDSLYYDYSVFPHPDEKLFVQSLRRAGNVVVAAQTADQEFPIAVRPGNWGARLADFPTKAAAMGFAAELTTNHLMAYFVPGPGGRCSVWLGGIPSAQQAEQRLEGLAALGDVELTQRPEIRELTAAERTDVADSEDWITARAPIVVPGAERLSIPSFDAWLLPRPEVADAVLRVGFANDSVRLLGGDKGDLYPIRDDDRDLPSLDVERQVRLFVKRGDKLYPSLALAALLAVEPGKLSVENGRFHYGDRSVPINKRGFMEVTYPQRKGVFGPGGEQPALGFSTILRNADRRERHLTTDPALASALKDRVVFVANAAADLRDSKVTLIENMQFGSAVEAAALRTLFLGDAVARAARETDARCALGLGLLGALYALVVFRYSRSQRFILIGGLGMAAAVALFGGYALHLFVESRLWLAVVTPTVAFMLAALGTGWINYGETDSDRNLVAEALGRYTSPAIVESVLRNPVLIAPKRAELTVLFSDIEGFTTISESMPAPRLAELLGTYFTEMVGPVAATRGHVDKFIGDAVMAFWNAPLPQEKHAQLAIKAALAMREKLVKLRPQLLKEFGVEVGARIGVNSGEVVVGELGTRATGDGAKMNYTCLGDAVNLASRLEGVNKVYGTRILCGPRTRELAGDAFVFREVDRVRVKGKHEAVGLFEPISAKGERLEAAQKELLTRYAAGLEAYRARQFDRARTLFQSALQAVPEDGPSRVFQERCARLVTAEPPADWDGAFDLEHK